MNKMKSYYLLCPFCNTKQNVDFSDIATKHECVYGKCESRFVIESDMTFTAGLSHLGISGIEKGILR